MLLQIRYLSMLNEFCKLVSILITFFLPKKMPTGFELLVANQRSGVLASPPAPGHHRGDNGPKVQYVFIYLTD